MANMRPNRPKRPFYMMPDKALGPNRSARHRHSTPQPWRLATIRRNRPKKMVRKATSTCTTQPPRLDHMLCGHLQRPNLLNHRRSCHLCLLSVLPGHHPLFQDRRAHRALPVSRMKICGVSRARARLPIRRMARTGTQIPTLCRAGRYRTRGLACNVPVARASAAAMAVCALLLVWMRPCPCQTSRRSLAGVGCLRRPCSWCRVACRRTCGCIGARLMGATSALLAGNI